MRPRREEHADEHHCPEHVQKERWVPAVRADRRQHRSGPRLPDHVREDHQHGHGRGKLHADRLPAAHLRDEFGPGGVIRLRQPSGLGGDLPVRVCRPAAGLRSDRPEDDVAGTVKELCSQLLLSSINELNDLYYSAC